MFTSSLFSDIRPVSGYSIAALVLVHASLKGVFFSRGFMEYVADPVYDLTQGFVTHSAAAGLLETAILLLVLGTVARLRAIDLGIRGSRLLSGITVTIFVWSLVQIATVVVGRLDGGVLLFGRTWSLSGSSFGAGLVEAHAGGAFIEEVIYRGFLLPQVFLLLVARTSWNTSKALLVALLSSQAYFALNHLPAALLTYKEEWLGTALYIIQVLLVGILFAAIYIRTGNLFVAIGLHALINFPSELFVSRLDPFLLVLMACCAILIAWPYLNRSLEDVFTLRPSFIQPQQSVSKNVKVLR